MEIKQYEILFETLERTTRVDRARTVVTFGRTKADLSHKAGFNDKEAIKIITQLDKTGNNIIYILYSMFMKKNNFPLNKFIIKEEETDNAGGQEEVEVEMDFKKMPTSLKSILLQFADKHSKKDQVAEELGV